MKKKLKPPTEKDLKATKKAEALSKIIFYSNFFMGSLDMGFENVHMSDDELFYVAQAATEMGSIKVQRAIFDAVHFQCDDDSVTRFLDHFPETYREKVMISC